MLIAFAETRLLLPIIANDFFSRYCDRTPADYREQAPLSFAFIPTDGRGYAREENNEFLRLPLSQVGFILFD